MVNEKGISGFRTTADRQRYLARYDALVAECWPVDHDEVDVDTSLGTTHVRRSGAPNGAPVVLLHPTAGSSAGWYPIIAALCARHPVHMPDTIGTAGRSVQTAPVLDAADLARWLDEVLDRLALEDVHLVGYSEGGWIAGVHAAVTARPERLATLTLIEPGGAIERIPTRRIVAFVLRGARAMLARDKPHAIRTFNRWMNGDAELTDAQVELLLLAMRNFRQRLPRPDRLSDAELRHIRPPTHLLLAAESRVIDPAKASARARPLIPDLTIDVVPGVGHGLVFQHPDDIVRRILEFCDQDPARRPGEPDPPGSTAATTGPA